MLGKIEMHIVQIQISDAIYSRALKRANEAGFQDIAEYATHTLVTDLSEDQANLDHLFTPERLAHIETAYAKVQSGEGTHTLDQVREHFKNRFPE